MGRLGLAFRCFFAVLGGKPLPDEALPAPEPPPPSLPAHEELLKRNIPAVQIMGILQKEGRLLDFLQEDIAGYTDEQVGAAVRSIHRDCHKVVSEILSVEPVMAGEEDSPVTVPVGFDPSRVRLIGNVTGEPPFEGTLRHKGWRATRVRLSELPDGHDPTVVAPAEVEI